MLFKFPVFIQNLFTFMKFGKLKNVDNIDFSLPSTTFHLKKREPSPDFKVYIGAPKWGVKEWVGKVYPPKTSAKNYLLEYAKVFNSIELNTTFYRSPSPELILNWKSQVDENFKFCPKVPSSISHYGKLEDKVLEFRQFVKTVYKLGENLGSIFLQLNDSYSAMSKADLMKLIEGMNGYRFALELRHESWFDGDESFFEFCAHHNVSVVISDVSGRRDVAHMHVTTPTVMIRFGGNELHPTDYKRIDIWIERILEMKQNGVEQIYFFMHQHEELLLPEIADYFIEKWNKVSDVKLEEIKRYDGGMR